MGSQPILDDATTKLIFSNIKDIYVNNQKLLQELSTRVQNWNLEKTIADTFVNYVSKVNAFTLLMCLDRTVHETLSNILPRV
jgi:hypothetical protein